MRKQFVKLISLFSVFVLLCCPVLHLFASALSASAEVVSAKVDPEVMAAFADGAETVKVYVWLKDIDQKQVDAIVEQKTGLRADNLAVIDENISTELATRIVSEADNAKLTDETEKLLQAYLDRTAVQRTLERERTDLYTATRRAEAKAKYNEKSATFLSKNAISSEKVIFNSNYAPMLILELTKQEVKSIAARADVESVKIYENLTITSTGSLAENMETIGINRIKTISGLTGAGVKVGIAEPFTFSEDLAGTAFGDRLTIIDGITENEMVQTNAHSYMVSSIAAGSEGIADEATIYLVGISDQEENGNGLGTGGGYFNSIETLISVGVNVINMSFGFVSTEEPSYNAVCQWTDHIVSQHGVTVVASAGNYNSTTNPNNYVSVPGAAENVITLGFYTHESVNSDIVPVLSEYSSYDNGSAVAKPDLIAYGECNGSFGTSFSAPIVTGTIALILELRSSLAVFPHILKAIVMASCHEKAEMPNESYENETMEMGITERQGAGIFNPFIAVSIASHGTFGAGIAKNLDLIKTIYIRQPNTKTESINVSLTWLREVTPQYNSHTSPHLEVGNKHAFDLRLYSGDNLLAFSEIDNTSAQVIYTHFDENSNDDCEFWLYRTSMGSGVAKFAYAWSISTVRFQYSYPFEGIGYLKNGESENYLQANFENMQIFQNQSFNGSFEQMWIIRKNTSTANYKIQSAFNSIGSISIDNINLATISATTSKNINILQNIDGSLSFVYSDGISTYALGIENSSTTTGALAVWSAYSGTLLDSQKWYFEPCAYQRGDVDFDKVVSSADARLILRYSSGLESFTTLQKFLADVDGSGSVGANDARLAERYAAGYDY